MTSGDLYFVNEIHFVYSDVSSTFLINFEIDVVQVLKASLAHAMFIVPVFLIEA